MSEYSVELKGLNKVYSNLLKEDTIALKDINLQIRPGEFISIIGPSGCGKSTLLRIIGNLDKPTSGTIEYRDGADQQMGFVFQDSVLLPWKNVRQNAEFPLVIQKKQTKENEEKLDELLELAGLSEFKTALPRELSGGMKQRVVIAIALACRPDLIIADEPTTALDVTIQAQILELMNDLRHKLGMSIIMITHDLGVVAQMCEKIAVMYAGHIVEYGTTDEIFYNPQHEYTKGLINSIPKLNTAEHERLVPIEGTPVDLLNPPAGCPFAPRCKSCMKICLNKMPPKTELSDTHYTHCWLRQKEEFEKGGKAE